MQQRSHVPLRQVLLNQAINELAESVMSWGGPITRLNLLDLLLKTPVSRVLTEQHVPETELAECVEQVIRRQHLEVRGA